MPINELNDDKHDNTGELIDETLPKIVAVRKPEQKKDVKDDKPEHKQTASVKNGESEHKQETFASNDKPHRKQETPPRSDKPEHKQEPSTKGGKSEHKQELPTKESKPERRQDSLSHNKSEHKQEFSASINRFEHKREHPASNGKPEDKQDPPPQDDKSKHRQNTPIKGQPEYTPSASKPIEGAPEGTSVQSDAEKILDAPHKNEPEQTHTAQKAPAQDEVQRMLEHANGSATNNRAPRKPWRRKGMLVKSDELEKKASDEAVPSTEIAQDALAKDDAIPSTETAQAAPAKDDVVPSLAQEQETIADKETIAMDVLPEHNEHKDPEDISDAEKETIAEKATIAMDVLPDQSRDITEAIPEISRVPDEDKAFAKVNGHEPRNAPEKVKDAKKDKNVDDLNGQGKRKHPVRPDTYNEKRNSERQRVAVLAPLTKPDLLSPEERLALRRVRVNRILMHKRYRSRFYKEVAPRIVTVAAIILVVISIFLSSGAGAAYAYYESQLPLLNGMAQHSLFQTTRIYDRNGKMLYDLYDQQIGRGRRTYVNYNDISPLLVNATIAAEDHTFWTNGGVDPQGIARAAVTDAQSGGAAEGASTITQQLIKKQLFDNEQRTVPQKLREATLATALTQQYPKWKIMEMYLNTVYYGNIDYGVEEAARDFFRLQPQCTSTSCKPVVSHLTLAQASLLAGLPQSPTYYNPYLNKQSALERQTLVLQSMVSLHMITPQQMTQAQTETKNFQFKQDSDPHHMQAPHFVQYLISQVLVPLFGAQNLIDGGYNIYTTLDLDLENKVEQIVHSQLYEAQNDPYLGYHGPLDTTKNVNNAAAVVINPKNGEILAMDGSADYNQNTQQMQGQYNAAISPRQPGSSMKPIVYATAFEMGWYPAMILPDHKTTYPVLTGLNQYYAPQNYDQTYHNGFPMTIRAATANSYNIPAVDAIEFTGIQNVLNVAGRLGLTEISSLNAKDVGPSMAIGSKEVTPLHMTDAYATFANQGVHIPPTSILQISDNQGNVLYKYNESNPPGTQALRPGVAFLINSILSDKAARYHEFSPGNPLELDRPAAAKTGTTDSFRDNWTVGYTPHIAVGVWAGNSDNEIMNNVIGITGAGPIWHDIMEYASQHYNFPPDDFPRPSDVHQGTVSASTGLLPRPGEATVTDWFIDGTMPTIQSNGSDIIQNNGDNNKKHHKKNDNNNNNNNNNGN